MPVSATAATQAVTPVRSPSSARPRRISSSGRSAQGIASSRGIGRHHQLRGQVLLREILGDRARHLGGRSDTHNRGLHALGHADEELYLLLWSEACRALWDDVPRRRLELRPQLRRARLRHRSALERFPDAAQDLLPAVGHRRAPRCRSAQRLWKLRPSGAGMSRTRVQPAASGNVRKRPRRRPTAPRTRVAIPVSA